MNKIQHENSCSKKSLYSTFFFHWFNDMHTTSLPTIIPLLNESISLSLSQAGFLTASFGMTNFLVQPFSGYFADKFKKPWFMVFGPLLSIAATSCLSLSPNFTIAFILTSLLAFGTALFHPQGSGVCGAHSGNNLAFNISIFHACGTLGSSLGPIYIVFMVSTFGRKIFPMLIIPIAVAICLFIWKHISNIHNPSEPKKKEKKDGNFFQKLFYLLPIVGSIMLLASLRDAASQSVKTFLPTLFISRGESIAFGGGLLFVFSLLSAIAGIIGGKLGDKYGEMKVLLPTVFFGPIFLFAGFNTHGILGIILLTVGYVILQTSTPLTASIAQKKHPDMRSMASSLVQGSSWGLANLLVTPVGVAADIIGLQNALNFAIFLPWIMLFYFAAKYLLKRS